jgi:phosphate/sulfate permease
MKSRKLPLSTSTCALYSATVGIGFLGGVLCFASMASMAVRHGYPWWPVVLLTVLWVVTLVVAVVVGVIRCRQVRRMGINDRNGT